MRTVLQCRLTALARATRHPGIPVARFLRCPCYSNRTLPEAHVLRLSHASRGTCSTVIARISRRIVLQCRLAAPTRATLQPGIPDVRFPRRSFYSDRTLPESYCTTVSPSSANSCNPGFPSHASRGIYATVIARFPRRTVLQCRLPTPARATRHSGIPVARFPMHPCYSDRTHPEAPPCYIDRTHPEAYCATVSA